VSETKTFSALEVAGCFSGIVLEEGGFSGVAEHVMGHPIWTHEFADRELHERLQFTLGELFPELRGIDFNGITPENVEQRVKQIKSTMPATFDVPRGAADRKEDPVESLKRLAPNAKIITIEKPQ
jgi:hypothetical protein